MEGRGSCGCPVLTGGVVHERECVFYPKPVCSMDTPQYLQNDRELLLEIINYLKRIDANLDTIRLRK